jgi:hypothetical protein
MTGDSSTAQSSRPPSGGGRITQYRDLFGKPGVTVSPIGYTNFPDVSVGYLNNGADFGPDTGGTTTCGIQEALNVNHYVRLIDSFEQPYIITTPISVSSYQTLEGCGKYATKISTPSAGSIATPMMQWKQVATLNTNLKLKGFQLVGDNSSGTGLLLLDQFAVEGSSQSVLSDLYINETGANLSANLGGCEDTVLSDCIIGNTGGQALEWLIPYGEGWMRNCSFNGATLQGQLFVLSGVEIGTTGTNNAGTLIVQNIPLPSGQSEATAVYLWDGYSNGNSTWTKAPLRIVQGSGNPGTGVSVRMKGNFYISGGSAAAIDNFSGSPPTIPTFIDVQGTNFYSFTGSAIPLANNYANLTILAKSASGYNVTMPQATMGTNPPVSGTVYQNTSGVDIEIYLPVTFTPTAGSASSLTPALGATSSPSGLPVVSVPAGTALDSFVLTYRLRVPSTYYFSFTITNGSLGTAGVVLAS